MKKVLAIVVALAAGSAFALPTPQTANFNAKVTVSKSCIVSATDLDFGSYDPLSATDTPATNANAISMQCSKGTSYTIGLSVGSGASYAARTMNGPVAGEKLPYQIYADAPHAQVWGDGTAGTITVSGTAPDKAAHPVPMYGNIIAGYDRTQGNYSDPIVATVTF